jgi:acyl-CoA thioester hydrolase
MDMPLDPPDLSAPFDRHRARVLPEWIDYNGHMNVAFYLYAFDQATETLCVALGCAADYVRQKRGMLFTLETHVTYDREVALGDPLRITSQILDWDAKRLHFFHHMYHADQGYLAATNEQIMLHVGYQSRRSAPFTDKVAARVAAMAQAHAGLSRPVQAGRIIGIPRKQPGSRA